MIAFRRCDFFCEELLPLVVLSHALLTYLWCLFRISYSVCAKTNTLSHIFLVNFLQLMMSSGKDYLFPLQILNRLAF